MHYVIIQYVELHTSSARLHVLYTEYVHYIYIIIQQLFWRIVMVGILYGNQTSNYFNVSLPDGFIDYYINQEDLP